MNSKVGRLIGKYDLPGAGEWLIDAWTGNGEERRSLRDLADSFNERLLRAAMDDAGMTTLDGEVANTYRLLTDEEVSTGVRTRAETTLERNGVDPDELRSDFVSHQAIHTYLTRDRGATRPAEPPAGERIENAESAIQRLGSRLVAVAEKRLQSLRDGGTISLGEFSVLLDLRVVCEDCGTHAAIPTLLDDGGCECSTDEG
jgi:hypothetical protein